MEYSVYKYSAIVGCTLVLLQVGLQVLGLGGDTDAVGDVDVDVDADAPEGGFDATDGHGDMFFGILSFKALCAFFGIFGLVGLTVFHNGWSLMARISTAAAAGVAGMFFVGWMMRSLARLQSSGAVNVRNAVGRTGTVYLRIPGENGGTGKVTLEIQGRSMEFSAVTDGGEIDTGKRVTVTSVEGDETLKVIPV